MLLDSQQGGWKMRRIRALLIALIMVWASVCTGAEDNTQPVSSETNPPEVTSLPPTVDNGVGDPQSNGECVVGEAGPETGTEVVTTEGVKGEATVEPKPNEGQGQVDPRAGDSGEVVGSEPVGDKDAGEPKSEDGTGSKDGSSEDAEPVYMKPVFVILGADGGAEATDPGSDSGSDVGNVIRTALPTSNDESATVGILAEFADGVGLTSHAVTLATTPAPVNVTLNLAGMPSTTQMWSGVGLNVAARLPVFADVAVSLPSFVGQPADLTSQVAATISGTLGASHLQMPQAPAGF
jgi:hypothetical protein